MKSGYVAVIGRANAGKSTLINVLVGEKVAIVSPRPQTTRERILGVLTSNDYQIVFVDTPGLYKADNLLNSVMQKTTDDSVVDVDLIMFVVDAHEGLSENDKQLIEKYSKTDIPFIIVLSKTDIMPESLLISEIKELSEFNKTIVPVSARKGKNLKELIKVILNDLPESDKIFSNDVISDRSERFMVGEIIREKILVKFDEEIPHGVAVIINTFKLREDKKVYEINVDIICEKPNHKAILIGKGGSAIKEISSRAREDLEKFLGKKVFLTTYIKVKEDWRNSEYLIRQHGYFENLD
jgi:GTP-binding protein Era